MINLSGTIDVFVITNGRSTFDYCKKSIENQQGVIFKPTYIKNRGWQEAHEILLKKCESKFALRVDDDMLLHPMALKFMYQCVKKQKDDIALRGWRLWEPWSNKVCKGIKVYNHKIAKKVGFKLDHLGKIDKPFTRNAEKAGYKIKYTRDVVAIHSCGDFSEHLKYWEMRGEAKNGNFTEKKIWAENLIKSCKMNLQEQYDLNKKFIGDYNIKKGYDFGKFIK
jgi:hypothetical protein